MNEGKPLRELYPSEIQRKALAYCNLLETDGFKEHITACFRADPKLACIENLQLSMGEGSVGCSFYYLSAWYLWCLREFGQEVVDMHLDLLRKQAPRQLMVAVWIYGIEVKTEIDLGEGYLLRPVSEMPESYEKEFFGQDFFVRPPAFLPLARAAVTKVVEIPLLSLGPDSRPVKENFERCRNIATLMNLVPNIAVGEGLSTTYVLPASAPLGIFGPQCGAWPAVDVPVAPHDYVVLDDLPILVEAIKDFYERSGKDQAVILLVLRRLAQAKRRKQLEDKMLDLGLALEFLLLSDNVKDQQLAVSFRLRGAWLIGENPVDRENIYKMLRDIYDARSAVAHTGKLKNAEALAGKMNEYFSLAELLILKVIKNGTPNWTALMLGIT